MSSSYFLVFLLGLLVLFTGATGTVETSRPFFGRNMYSRGSVEIKPIEKTREAMLMQDEKLKPSVSSSTFGKKESMQMGVEETSLKDMNAAAYHKDAKNVGKMIGDNDKRPDCGEKLDKESKYYDAAGANVHKVEGANQ